MKSPVYKNAGDGIVLQTAVSTICYGITHTEMHSNSTSQLTNLERDSSNFYKVKPFPAAQCIERYKL